MKPILLSIGAILLALWTVSNVLISQAVSPFFPAITLYKDFDQTVLFLKNIRATDTFPTQLAYFKTLYGPAVEERAFSEDQKRIATIKNLETILAKNPKSTDILLNLSQLHRANAQIELADHYLREAKAVDPWIK